jgi:hypothetical protein
VDTCGSTTAVSRAGGDRGGVVARGCHGTTHAKPRQLEDREVAGVGIWRSVGARWQRVKTLAAGGARHGRRRRRRSNRGGSGVDQGALVPCDQRRQSEWPGLAGARAGGGGGVGSSSGSSGGRRGAVIGRFD